MTTHYTWGPVTTLHDLELPWDNIRRHFLGSHNFLDTTIGSCVKWPYVQWINTTKGLNIWPNTQLLWASPSFRNMYSICFFFQTFLYIILYQGEKNTALTYDSHDQIYIYVFAYKGIQVVHFYSLFNLFEECTTWFWDNVNVDQIGKKWKHVA